MNDEVLNGSKPDRDASIKKIQAFLETRVDIWFAYIFGSFLDEEHFRDIDLGIYIDETAAITKDKFYDIELSTKIEEIVRFPVDIIVLNRAPAAIVYNASKGMLLKNTDDDLRVDFIILSWNKYWDYKHILRDHMEERKRGSQ
jgi:predicted nucleotidyltransferase